MVKSIDSFLERNKKGPMARDGLREYRKECIYDRSMIKKGKKKNARVCVDNLSRTQYDIEIMKLNF